MKWFYIDTSITDGDRRQGPYSIDEIRDFVNEGKIKDETLVWHTGEANWKAWKDFPEASEPPEPTEEELLKQTIETLLQSKMNRKRYAGFFVRANAFIIDNIILSIVGALFLYVMSLAGMLDLNAVSEIVNQYIDNPGSTDLVSKALDLPGMSTFFTIWSIVQAIYFIVFHAVWGATPGKKLLRIHVEMANGEKLSWAFSFFRFVASIVTQATLIFYGLGYLIVLIDPQKRALHDFVAQTRVVHNAIEQKEKKEV
ncbi:RDD family protein [Fibrobacter succinogenes subsp. succinogenes S85]|uniref:RDD domain containing protein n=1 Tax=Fibrobacter succinogenes (strain ATCC 19169 / S85) TaxID=59374 RepID=C9RJU2_FIBSS|nr:RDD family protein [Fibrobacter succinogenes]ACX73805.1 RDD domain containing protein [Fibrobacter succinogenes subsp. succinogenes S85]ADL27396.1 RDD family protein [Fibrobacter succinogenes subsp. succinogenes S85]